MLIRRMALELGNLATRFLENDFVNIQPLDNSQSMGNSMQVIPDTQKDTISMYIILGVCVPHTIVQPAKCTVCLCKSVVDLPVNPRI